MPPSQLQKPDIISFWFKTRKDSLNLHQINSKRLDLIMAFEYILLVGRLKSSQE